MLKRRDTLKSQESRGQLEIDTTLLLYSILCCSILWLKHVPNIWKVILLQFADPGPDTVKVFDSKTR